MTDPKTLIRGYCETLWAVVDVTPSYHEDIFDEKAKLPQVVVSHVLTQPKVIAFSDTLDEDNRYYIGTYAVDVWSLKKDERWLMMKEVDRIFQSLIYGDDQIDQYEPKAWRDINAVETNPKLYHSQILIEVRYYS